MNINTKYTSTHNTSTRTKKIEWIVLHYTANKTSKEGMAKNNANYFATTDRQASADFIVDDVMTVQYNAEPLKRYCWAVGGKKNPYSKNGGKYYGKCTNGNSVSIEICSSMDKDGKYYFTDKVLRNALELTQYLMQKYNIDKDHILCHWDISGKACPNVEGWIEDDRTAFEEFKSRL